MAAEQTKKKHPGGRPPMIVPVYMTEAELGKKPYFQATDLAAWEHDLREAVANITDIKNKPSQGTVNQYCKQLKRLTEILGQNVEWILSNSTSALKLLLGAQRRDGKSMLQEWGTLKGLMMSLMAVWKHVPRAMEGWPDGYEVWQAEWTDKIKPLAKEKAGSNELSERQQKGMVEWDKVVEMRQELLKTQPMMMMMMGSLQLPVVHRTVKPNEAD